MRSNPLARLRRVRIQKLGFRPDVQGLRAIAVLLVVAYHAGVPGITGGYIGVDVFFVISGFLITAHILKDLAENDRVRFAQFYARRIMRILPASVVVLAGSLAAAALTIPPLLLPTVFKDGLFTALYIPNLHFANKEIDYLSDPNPSVFQHYWSLGVEEQFYLVWPAVLMLLFLVTRKSVRGIAVSLFVGLTLSFASSVWLTTRSQPDAFFMMPSRAWEFALGGLLAVVATATTVQLTKGAAALARWLGIAGMIIGAVAFTDQTAFPGVAAALPVVAAGLVILAGIRHSGDEGSGLWNGLAFLCARPMVFIGTISYSLYLVHWPLLIIPQIVAGDHNPLPLWQKLALATACVPVAWLLYRFVEEPFRRLRVPTSRTMTVALVTTCLLVAVGLGGQRIINAAPFHTDEIAAPPVVSPNPPEAPVVPSNLSPAIRSASSNNPTIYALGCHLSALETEPKPCSFGDNADAPHVVLFGDSHAAQWFPPLEVLAESGKITLTSHTKSSCSPLIPEPGAVCVAWRDSVTTEINESPPDLVLISAYPGDQAVQPTPEAWERSTALALSQLNADIPVTLITDTPQFDMSAASCLSKNLDDVHACGTTPERALSLPMTRAQQRAAEQGGASTIDLTSYFCTDDWCPVVTGNVLMYRDAHHVSAVYSTLLSEALREQLAPLFGAP